MQTNEAKFSVLDSKPLKEGEKDDEVSSPNVEEVKVEDFRYKLFSPKSSQSPATLDLIVMVHGLTSKLITFDETAKQLLSNTSLQDKFQILIYDQRGHGTSPHHIGGDYALQTLAQDLYNLVKHLQSQKLVLQNGDKFHLVGHSFGGRVSAIFAAKYPELLKSLTIEDMDFVTKNASTTEEAMQHYQRMFNSYKHVFSKKELDDYMTPAFTSKYFEMWSTKYKKMPAPESTAATTQQEEPTEHYHVMFLPFVAGLFAHFSRTADFTEVANTLVQKNIPTLFLGAEKGTSITTTGEQQIKQLESQSPSIKYIFVPGSGHNIHASQAEAFMKHLSEFIEKYN